MGTLDAFSKLDRAYLGKIRFSPLWLTWAVLSVISEPEEKTIKIRDSFGAVLTLFCAVVLILAVSFIVAFYNDYDPLIAGERPDIQTNSDTSEIDKYSSPLNSYRTASLLSVGDDIVGKSTDRWILDMLGTIQFNITFTFFDFRVRIHSI